ncbi:MAG: flagellar hook-associated protein FlgL [Bacteroidetes bacterium]|nr:flagellar hook-associated protein FlgL [Bacteroidota bacterium]MCL5027282.1 flagellar hook-associated protein FlgL [Chloroflexota bacterium]
MRITHNMLSETTLRNLNTNLERMERLQDQLTSGQKIRAPSDDPIGTAAALEFRGTLSELDQYVSNADAASSWLDASDSALGSVIDALHRARELAVQGGNDTSSVADKQSMANEVEQLIEHAVAVGNSTYAGQYVFAGFKVTTAPFAMATDGASVTYSGDSGKISRKIDTNAAVTINIPGNDGFGQVFSALVALRDALKGGNSATVSATIADLDGAIDSVLSSRTELGARTNRVSNQSERLQNLKVNIAQLLSKKQDVDMTETITQFAVQQSVYQAALAAGAKAIQPSLLDQLR